ncbi:hypothetical protein ACFPM0_20125 [Pseudonocardia sulfidoxydans]|uniref:hypothetical protein n=1 Tax=Pseudonocardia sulfidoxydans TaxID=54011 RepID=UPI00361A011D
MVSPLSGERTERTPGTVGRSAGKLRRPRQGAGPDVELGVGVGARCAWPACRPARAAPVLSALPGVRLRNAIGARPARTFCGRRVSRRGCVVRGTCLVTVEPACCRQMPGMGVVRVLVAALLWGRRASSAVGGCAAGGALFAERIW